MSRSRQQRDKSMQGWVSKDPFSDRSFSASIGNDFTEGHRGMARAAKGAKKFINSRRRFHERMGLRRLGSSDE
jgi:hypothetical protein